MKKRGTGGQKAFKVACAGLACAFVWGLTPGSPGLPSASAARFLPGIDVSHWQGDIDWARVARAGYRFTFAKATEGRTYTDPMYGINRSGATGAGLRFGAYHFSRPGGRTLAKVRLDARKEAGHFIAAARPRAGNLLPVLDMESSGGLSTSKLQTWTSAWLRKVTRRVGAKPIIYTGPSFWRTYMGDTSRFADAGYKVLWIAHWTDAGGPSVPGHNWGGKGWTFWQWTDCGRVPGVDGCVDKDRYNGTRLRAVRVPSADATAPSVPKVALSGHRFQRSVGFDVSWRSVDRSSGVSRYSVRYRRASLASDFGAEIGWRTATTHRSAHFKGGPGHSYCFSARARDGAGNVSAWSSARCTTVPADDRALAASAAWARTRPEGRYRGTLSVSGHQGSTLSRSHVRAKRLALLVDKCKGCGSVKVFWNGDLLSTVDLTASSTRQRRLVTVARWPSAVAGTVALRVSSRGRRVAIDGIGASRSL
jgi:GH25 family lysozyme M1 (1,4-beta-N-acetylmuramidase)